MHDVLILSLVDGGDCGRRVPVLECADALRAAGATVSLVTAGSDEEIDKALESSARLVIAADRDSQVRHVVRRMVRLLSPAPSKRPDDMPDGRTIPDLPTIAILPLAEGGLPAQLGLPATPRDVADAVLGETRLELDLLRHDGGSVTLDGVLLGATDAAGIPIPWHGKVQVDDVLLSQGRDEIVALSVANAGGVSTVDGLPLVVDPDPGDGLIDVAIAVPVTHKPLFGRERLRYEVRRARGRAVAVLPHDDELPFLDDGVAGSLSRKRSWWIEPGAWSVYTLSSRPHREE